jgi:hypothetical protein
MSSLNLPHTSSSRILLTISSLTLLAYKNLLTGLLASSYTRARAPATPSFFNLPHSVQLNPTKGAAVVGHWV